MVLKKVLINRYLVCMLFGIFFGCAEHSDRLKTPKSKPDTAIPVIEPEPEVFWPLEPAKPYTIDASSEKSFRQSFHLLLEDADHDLKKKANEALLRLYAQSRYDAAAGFLEKHERCPAEDELTNEDVFEMLSCRIDGLTLAEMVEKAEAIDEQELTKDLESLGVSPWPSISGGISAA